MAETRAMLVPKSANGWVVWCNDMLRSVLHVVVSPTNSNPMTAFDPDPPETSSSSANHKTSHTREALATLRATRKQASTGTIELARS